MAFRGLQLDTGLRERRGVREEPSCMSRKHNNDNWLRDFGASGSDAGDGVVTVSLRSVQRDPVWGPLLRAARLGWKRAYAPYSRFAVGAAVEAGAGAIFVGCNVENLSFGLTNCAERVAIQSAIASGQRKLHRIVIFSESKVCVSPCGACRQVMSEFSVSMPILSVTRSGQASLFELSKLLPRAREGILG